MELATKIGKPYLITDLKKDEEIQSDIQTLNINVSKVILN